MLSSWLVPMLLICNEVIDFFAFAVYFFYSSLIFLFFSSVTIPYSTALAVAGKQAVPATLSFGTALSSQPIESLVAELQIALCKSQDVVSMLSSRVLRLPDTAMELVVAMEANARL